ncbi:MAG: thermonuclease family protein [Candidatus Roizmanbacteria bacterium]
MATIDPEQVPDVPFKDQLVPAKVYDVHDGDTVHVLLAFGNQPVKFAIRILGIDTPEVRAGEGRLPQEKIAGLKARDYLKSILIGQVQVKIHDWDKYGGRLLGDIILLNGQSVSQVMLDSGYGKPYHGEKKQTWTLHELQSGPFA